MRLPWMTAALAFGLMAGTPETKPADLVIHLIREGPSAVFPAKRLATSMFAAAGVRVIWRNGEPVAAEPGVVRLTVQLARGTRPCYLPGALGCAYPYGGTDRAIVIFMEPLREDARSHVLVHEITHVLEGVDGHAQTGVMKARYDKADMYAMRAGPLPFEPQDVRMIRAGLASLRLRAGASPSRAGRLQ